MSDSLYDDIGLCDECQTIQPRACVGGALWCYDCVYYSESIPGPTDEEYAIMDAMHHYGDFR